MLCRAYLSKGTALEVQVHRRRPGGDDVNRLVATLSRTSSPPRERAEREERERARERERERELLIN